MKWELELLTLVGGRGVGTEEWLEPAATQRKPHSAEGSAPTAPLGNERGLKCPFYKFPHDTQEFPGFIGNSFPLYMNINEE